MPEPDPIAADRRRERRRTKIPPDAACALCGERDPDVLQLLEAHHALGKTAAPDVTVVLCRNHHAIQTARQHDHDALPPLGRGAHPESVLERIARALISLALLVDELAQSLNAFAAQLFVLARQLDLAVPGWREWEVAR